ncbi:MAG TPA: alpha/beta hydrolase [Burkholderiaceae bacterium]|nr:alpha/beta hydrolase [Burkholderiaceae bacterium]
MTQNPAATLPYVVRRASRSRFVTVRGLRHHVLEWGDAALATPERPTLVMQHGWMDVAASFQFVVDALDRDRHVIAFDWRGFGLSDASGADTYWLPDYLGDLDAMLTACFFDADRALAPAETIDLLGHSMGGNVVMLYAGLRPQRIRRLVNLEGFGMPATKPSQAPKRYLQWLEELKTPAELRDYESLAAVAARLRKTNPLLPPQRADWLAQHWSREVTDAASGTTRFEILGDAVHKRISPTLYQRDEVLEVWKLIEAPLLWVEGDQTDLSRWWGTRYTKAEFHERLNVVRQVEREVLSPAGHMLHHDQPQALAARLEAFLEDRSP